jgi:topoisomerase-4 subunit B
LLKGVTVSLLVEKTGQKTVWKFEKGLEGYLEQALADAEPVAPVFSGDLEVDTAVEEGFAQGEGAAWSLAFTAEGGAFRESFVNLIPTPAGGTHESGLREGVFNAVKSFCEIHALLPKGVRLLPEDVFGRASFVLSAKVLDPQFQGQIKERLNSRDAVRLVAGLVRPALELWLNHHIEAGRRIAELAIRQAQIRTREGQKVEKKKSSSVAVLPGKLTDCESTDLSRNELFLVEGDSAGGSAKMGRDKEFQAVLPLRGKVLNAWETERDRLFANQEIHDISVAIGVDPHEKAADANLSGLRYGKICILSDADVDGSHIQVLLLTLFYKHFPALIEKGHVCVARPPLFRLDVPAHRKRPARKVYCLDEAELHAAREKLESDGINLQGTQVSRFKGLGEMNAEQLWETTLNPDTRRLLPVGLGELDDTATRDMMNLLMGRNESGARRTWLEARGNLVEVDI